MGVIKTFIVILSAVFLSSLFFTAQTVMAAETIKIGTVLSMSDAASQSGAKANQKSRRPESRCFGCVCGRWQQRDGDFLSLPQ